MTAAYGAMGSDGASRTTSLSMALRASLRRLTDVLCLGSSIRCTTFLSTPRRSARADCVRPLARKTSVRAAFRAMSMGSATMRSPGSGALGRGDGFPCPEASVNGGVQGGPQPQEEPQLHPRPIVRHSGKSRNDTTISSSL